MLSHIDQTIVAANHRMKKIRIRNSATRSYSKNINKTPTKPITQPSEPNLNKIVRILKLSVLLATILAAKPPTKKAIKIKSGNIKRQPSSGAGATSIQYDN